MAYKAICQVCNFKCVLSGRNKRVLYTNKMPKRLVWNIFQPTLGQ